MDDMTPEQEEKLRVFLIRLPDLFESLCNATLALSKAQQAAAVSLEAIAKLLEHDVRAAATAAAAVPRSPIAVGYEGPSP